MEARLASSEAASTPRSTDRRWALALVTVCFFLSGVASLTLEVVWTRELRLVFGSTTLAASTILVAYMLGLGMGGVIGGRLADRLRRGVRVYGWVEVAIGLYALVVPLLLARLPALSQALLSDLSLWSATLCRFAISLAALLVPTILMGATLPILVAALVRGDVRIGERTGLLYGLNTLGAVIGVFLSTFVLFPMIGVQGTNRVGAFLDIGVGLLTVVALAPRVASGVAPPVATAARRWTSWAELPILVSYALVGFSALVYEVAWTRALSMVLGSSLHAFSAMLAAFLTGIGIGSLVTRRWIDRLQRPSLVYAWGIATVGALSLGTMLVLPQLPGLFVRVVASLGLQPTQLVLTNLCLAGIAMLPPTLVFGALFPLVARVLAERSPAPGEAVGRVYFANTLGSAAGAFAAGFLLIPALGLRDTLALASIVNLATAGGLLLLDTSGSRSSRLARAALPLAAAGLLIAFPMPWRQEAFARGAFRDLRQTLDVGIQLQPLEGLPPNGVLFYRDGLNSTVSVQRLRNHIYLSNNGKVDASTERDIATQVLLGEVPMLFGPPAKNVLVVGLASGVTLGSVVAHPVERVDAAEIEPAIVPASHFFDHVNGKPLEDPRVHLVIDDARTYLGSTRAQYDVVISEPSNPWITGVSNLFTREFFHMVRDRLAPGGRFMQWVQLYGLDASGVETILAALSAEFPYVYGFVDKAGQVDLLLLAMQQPLRRQDLPHWATLPKAAQADLLRIGNFSTSDLWSLLRLRPEDVRAIVKQAPVANSDDNMFIELRAPWTLYQETVADNWKQLLAGNEEGILPLLQEMQEPLDPAVVARLALSYTVTRGDLEVGLKLATTAMEQEHSALPIAATVQLAVAASEEGSYERNLPFLDEAVVLQPADFEPRLLRAYVLAELGRNDEALLDVDAALQPNPDEPRALALRMRILHALGRDSAAADDADRVLASPFAARQMGLWRRAGEIYLAAGRDAAAVRALQVHLEASPDWVAGWSKLAAAYRRLGRKADADRAERNGAIAERNRVLDMHQSARREAAWGSYEEADKLLRAVVRLDPGYSPAREELKWVHPRARAARATRIRERRKDVKDQS